MNRTSKLFVSFLSIISLISILFAPVQSEATSVKAASAYSAIILSHYSKTMNIGDEFRLMAITASGKKVTFKSSKSSIASVNASGYVTAKKSGSVTITAKTKDGEAYCQVTVKKTEIHLSSKDIAMDAGYYSQLDATSSNGHSVTFKSNKSSIATISPSGRIYAKKPGIATITASCDDTKETCKIWVKSPIVTISDSTLTLQRCQSKKLSYTSTSRNMPKWKSNKSSIATVDANGKVTAVKHGTATISVTIDGITKSCTVTVEKPAIQLSAGEVTLKTGQTYTVTAKVSSGNKPEYRSSNKKVATVDSDGTVCAKKKGKAYIYAKEDGTSERMIVYVK